MVRLHSLDVITPPSSTALRPRWTAAQDEYLRMTYKTVAYAEIGAVVNKSAAAVRNRRYALRLPIEAKAWSDEDLQILRAAYEGVTFSEDIGLDELAISLGRIKSNVCRKARELGFTDNGRRHKAVRKVRVPIFDSKADRARATSVRIKAHQAANGHPRGMAGKKHTAEVKDTLREKSTARWEGLSQAERDAFTTRAMKGALEKRGYVGADPTNPRGSWKAGWREIGGKRNYYRSRWEANYGRYLEWLKQRGEIADWQHEPETFWFEGIKRGVRSYLPDFRVWANDGTTALHEVKGWMDARSKTTLRRMAKYHKAEKIEVIREKQYNAIARSVGPLIADWETSNRAGRL